MTPLPPGALANLLQTLPPERGNPFSHLENLTPDQLLQRRVEIAGQLKTLEQERKVIDTELMEVFSDPELRHEISAPGGWVLKQSRSNEAHIHLVNNIPLSTRNH